MNLIDLDIEKFETITRTYADDFTIDVNNFLNKGWKILTLEARAGGPGSEPKYIAYMGLIRDNKEERKEI